MNFPLPDVTSILSRVEQGDAGAADQLLPLVYQELRKLAASRMAFEQPGDTLQATALVHEAYLRLVGNNPHRRWENRGHFFAAAAEAMRRILVNRARDRKRLKRGGDRTKLPLESVETAVDAPDDHLLEIDEALQELAEEDSLAAQLVKLRFFVGLTLGEAAQALGVSRRTADRHWAYARARLLQQLEAAGGTRST